MESRAASFDGLHSLYIKKNEIDSVAKYAELSAVTNDSIYSGIVSNSSKIIKDLSDSNTEKDRQLMEADKNRWPAIFHHGCVCYLLKFYKDTRYIKTLKLIK